jgi:hypothetical protein
MELATAGDLGDWGTRETKIVLEERTSNTGLAKLSHLPGKILRKSIVKRTKSMRDKLWLLP